VEGIKPLLALRAGVVGDERWPTQPVSGIVTLLPISSRKRRDVKMIDLKNILLPTDFSETSLTATRYAIELAKRFSATLHLLHVIEDPGVYIAAFDSFPLPSPVEFETYAEERLENWVLPDDAAGLDIQRRWVHGVPFTQIIRDSRENDIDLIVLGTHGRSVISQLLLGSVAEKVVRKAPCSVLTVRPEGHQFVHP
jgi:nucleotide-binding universal stress UspA family protein